MIEIYSVNSAAVVQFSRRKPPGWREPAAACEVTLRDRDLKATTEVYLYQPDGLIQFFTSLVNLSGDRAAEWNSIEGQLALRATWLKASNTTPEEYIQLHVQLTPEEASSTGMVLLLKPKQLCEIADQLEQFLR